MDQGTKNTKNRTNPRHKHIHTRTKHNNTSRNILRWRNNNKHNSNKSLYQQSFTDKIFNDGDSNINVNINFDEYIDIGENTLDNFVKLPIYNKTK